MCVQGTTQYVILRYNGEERNVIDRSFLDLRLWLSFVFFFLSFFLSFFFLRCIMRRCLDISEEAKTGTP